MKASEVRLRDLTGWDACDKAIEDIENDWRNYVGGLARWNSGWETHLTDTAQRKIEAIARKGDRFPNDWEDLVNDS